MFDTHCHLNFSRFKKNLDEVVNNAKSAGITGIVVPGTDIITSKKAIEVAEKYEGIYAAVGIHPHHVYNFLGPASPLIPTSAPPEWPDMRAVGNPFERATQEKLELEKLVSHPKVVAIGECGLDRHEYVNTKYESYKVDDGFIGLQRQILKMQIDLAIKFGKSLILHNREAKTEMLPLLEKKWDKRLAGRAVFHCCEADEELLTFAKKHEIYIGVDGDVTYSKEKAEFIKKVPLEMLVLETDAPFLLPEPLKSQKLYPNEPKNIQVIAAYISKFCDLSIDRLIEITTKNAFKLFQIPHSNRG